MLYRWILWIACLLPFAGSAENPFDQTELLLVEQKIRMLKEHLHQNRLKELDEEVQSQGMMVGDWQAYAKDLQKIRSQELENKKIQIELEQLEQRKLELLKPLQSH